MMFFRVEFTNIKDFIDNEFEIVDSETEHRTEAVYIIMTLIAAFTIFYL